jgi:hypothetical protein
MIGENQQLVTDEPVEVGDCRIITDPFRGIFRMNPNLIKKFECGSGGWEWRLSAFTVINMGVTVRVAVISMGVAVISMGVAVINLR